MTRRRFLVLLSTAVLLLALVGGARAQGPVGHREVGVQAALGTAFTYQGRLTDGGSPADGSYDLRFILYDAAAGGAQIGDIVTQEDVPVKEGLFSVALDLGTAAFTGQARYLEVAVRVGDSTGAYTTLNPRQALTATPYALHALSAPWTGLSGVPAGLSDGDDDTTYTAGAGLRLSDSEFSVAFGGGGSASTISRSDHDHLGQAWVGSENPLVISGTFGSWPQNAPLVLGNADGDGLRVDRASEAGLYVYEAGDDGVFVGSAGSPSNTVGSGNRDGFEVAGAEGQGLFVGWAGFNGVDVHSAGRDGVRVYEAGDDGVYVYSAGSPSSAVFSRSKNGFEVAGAEGDGLYVGRADEDGVYVYSAGGRGVLVSSAGGSGVVVGSAGSPSATHFSPGKDGFEVAGAEDDGLYVGRADHDGVHIRSAGRYAGYLNGDVRVTGSLSKGGGSFKIDHPLDPEDKTLSHSFVESPDMMNVYNGNVTTDEEGYVTVRLPTYFEALNRDYRYQLTVIGTFAQAIVAQEVEDNRFVIQTDQPWVKVSWQVTGIRKDPWAEANRVVVEEDKPNEERGTYLHPQAYGVPEERGLAYLEAREEEAERPGEER